MAKNTLIVNMIAGPGAGKTTMAKYISALLTWNGIDNEFVPEFAKELFMEERHKTFEDQFYILGKQAHKIQRLIGKVDVIVTDAPILLQLYYKPKNASDNFDNLVLEMHKSYNTLNYFIQRDEHYSEVGRFQTRDEAILIDKSILRLLDKNNIKYFTTSSNEDAGRDIVSNIINIVNKK